MLSFHFDTNISQGENFMAFQYMFNFPIMELEIARKNIELMTNSNSQNDDDLWKNPILFKNNIEHGFIAATSLISCFDGILNYIVKSVGLDVSTKRVDNIRRLLNKYQKDPHQFLKSEENTMLKKLVFARNGLIHFENYNLGYLGNLADIIGNKVSYDDIFRQQEMQKHYENVKNILYSLSAIRQK